MIEPPSPLPAALVKTEWELEVSGEEPRIYAHEETVLAVSQIIDKRRKVTIYRRDTYRTEVVGKEVEG